MQPRHYCTVLLREIFFLVLATAMYYVEIGLEYLDYLGFDDVRYIH